MIIEGPHGGFGARFATLPMAFPYLTENAVLVMDDAWAKSHVEMLDCVDPASNSCVVVTSRVSGIAVGAPEVQLGSLPPDD